MWPFNKKNREETYSLDELEFIWGMRSGEDLSGEAADLYTMNDIEIDYYGKKNAYLLSVETAYLFEDKDKEIKYLCWLLDRFTDFMDINGYEKDEPYMFFFSSATTMSEAESIPELYTNFRIFVEGYKALYSKENTNE